MKTEPRQRGLLALNEARAARRRAIVFGKARMVGNATQFWHWTFIIFACFGVFYYWYAERELTRLKAEIMAEQRTVDAELGPKFRPFRDRIEAWTQELAGNWQEPLVGDGADLDAIVQGPGVYLRLRLEDTEDVEEIRRHAIKSLHDGFTSCLFPSPEAAKAREGKPCASISACDPGQLCNDWHVCAPPTQPFNLRLAYRAMRVLTPEWADELHQAPNDLAIRIFRRDLAQARDNDVPIATDLLERSQYFTLVLDEAPIGGLPEPEKRPADERQETEEERLWRSPHEARIGIWDLKLERPLLRIRAQADASFIAVGDSAVAPERTRMAQQRQVNSCALAVEVRAALRPKPAVSPEPSDQAPVDETENPGRAERPEVPGSDPAPTSSVAPGAD